MGSLQKSQHNGEPLQHSLPHLRKAPFVLAQAQKACDLYVLRLCCQAFIQSLLLWIGMLGYDTNDLFDPCPPYLHYLRYFTLHRFAFISFKENARLRCRIMLAPLLAALACCIFPTKHLTM